LFISRLTRRAKQLWYLENSPHPFSREPDLIVIAVLQESWWKLQNLSFEHSSKAMDKIDIRHHDGLIEIRLL
jgi:hypothetical protein